MLVFSYLCDMYQNQVPSSYKIFFSSLLSLVLLDWLRRICGFHHLWFLSFLYGILKKTFRRDLKMTFVEDGKFWIPFMSAGNRVLSPLSCTIHFYCVDWYDETLIDELKSRMRCTWRSKELKKGTLLAQWRWKLVSHLKFEAALSLSPVFAKALIKIEQHSFFKNIGKVWVGLNYRRLAILREKIRQCTWNVSIPHNVGKITSEWVSNLSLVTKIIPSDLWKTV